MKYIFNVIKEFRWSLLLIYFYIVLVEVIHLVEPYILVKSIDVLLKKEYGWLILFFTTSIVSNLLFFKRMLFDTKIYTKIYNKIVFKYLRSNKDSNTSTRVARTEMTNQIVGFLEHEIHYYISSVLSVFGSLFFIFLQHTPTGLVVLSCTIPITFIVFKFYKKIGQGTKILHSHYEKKMSTMDTNSMPLIESFFKRRARLIVYQSTIQGKNWFSLNSTKMCFLILALFVFTHNNINLTQGQAISMYAYINQFLISLLSIPVGMETFTRMKDILHRIKDN